MMLRDYEYTENWRLLDAALQQFIDLPERLSLVGFVALSPDSFMWKIFDGTTLYYLYAEDHVPSLDHVLHSIPPEFKPTAATLELIPVKHVVAFEDTTPNLTAQIYTPPQDEYNFARYAAQSGYDFVFLMRSSESIGDYATPQTIES
ncbi:MAG: hypothetical protein ABIR91_04175 [Candidatus Saccharimonadales bacterium]